MKTKSIALSLSFNVLFIGIGVYGLLQQKTSPVSPYPCHELDKPSSNTTNAVPNVHESKNLVFEWSSLESTDYRTYIANLRRIHCPEPTIRDLIIADVKKMYAAERKRVITSRLNVSTRQSQRVDKAGRQMLNEFVRQERTVLNELLGTDWERDLPECIADPSSFAQLDFLPAAKQNQVQQIEAEFSRKSEDIYQASNGFMTPEDHQLLRDVEMQRQQQLTQLLSSSEYEQYQLLTHPIAREMREGFYTYRDEEEFKSIFRLRQAFDASNGLETTSASSDFETAQLQLEANIKQVLGNQRYLEYQRAQDYDYQQLCQLAERCTLSIEVVGQVYELKKQYESQSQQLQMSSDSGKATEDTSRDLTNEISSKVSQLLGQSAFRAYQANGADWLVKN
jgi:hypothetical protein